MIKCDRSMTMEIETLLHFNAFRCFIDKELVWWHKMILVKKIRLVVMEVIDGQTLFLRTCDTWNQGFKYYYWNTYLNKVAINVISSPINPIVIGLSWLILHNLQLDWCYKKFSFWRTSKNSIKMWNLHPKASLVKVKTTI